MRAKKKFSELNYYDMLDIKPDASFFEVRQAYHAAMQLYRPEALASYSFFTEDERREILSLIDKAYATLINENARSAYDNELMLLGEIQTREQTRAAGKKPVNIFDINRNPAAKKAVVLNDAIKSRTQPSPEIEAILQQKEICGSDLKKIRMELNVLVEHISQETRVRLDHLRSIEEDNVVHLPAPVFLKGFVKSYLKCLGVESADEISSRYIDTLKRLQRK